MSHLRSAFQAQADQGETTRNAFAYVFAGSGTFSDASSRRQCLPNRLSIQSNASVYDANNHSLVLFDRGDEIAVQAGPEGIRSLLVSGKPLRSRLPCTPIVMNTEEKWLGDGRSPQWFVHCHDKSGHPASLPANKHLSVLCLTP